MAATFNHTAKHLCVLHLQVHVVDKITHTEYTSELVLW